MCNILTTKKDDDYHHYSNKNKSLQTSVQITFNTHILSNIIDE